MRNFSVLLCQVLGIWILLLGKFCDAQFTNIAEDREKQECGLVDEIPGDIRTKMPWTAGIFIRAGPNSPYKFLVTGSVIGPRTVLTLLGGGYGAQHYNRKYTLPQAGNILVGTGLNSTILDKNDEHAQFSEISYIVPNHKHPQENKEYHYVLLHLKKPLNLTTPYTRSVCLFELIFEPVDLENWVGWKTYFTGFTSPPGPDGSLVPKFLTLEITRGSYDLCNSAFNYHYGRQPQHEYCLRLTAGSTSNDTCALFGSSSVIEVTGIWFIGGMMALIPRRERGHCGLKTLYYFTDLIWCRDWLLRNIKCGPDQFACGNGKCVPLSSVCNSIRDCDDGFDEDFIYCEATNPCGTQKHRCGLQGECISEQKLCDGIKHCKDGSDENTEVCNTLGRPEIRLANYKEKRCYPIPLTEGVVINCVNSRNEKVNCTNAPVSTEATLRCANYYSSRHRSDFVTMTCRDDGFWHPFKTFVCQPDCGILSLDVKQPYISRGIIANDENGFPWHGIIFRLKQGQYIYLCGGSLIERNAMISVAHCLVELGSSRSLINVDQLRVVLAPVSSVYNENVASSKSMIFNVEKTWIPPTYDPRSLQSDIAIIKLSKHVKYTNLIRPICYLPQGSTNIPKPGTLGKVPGFGLDENNQVSTVLKYTDYPVISFSECSRALKMVPRLSTFCAGYKNAAIAVCQGDSGSGLVFPEKIRSKSVERYILRGVVSHGELTEARFCDRDNYAVFTHIDSFSDWILDILEGIDVNRTEINDDS